MFIWTSFHGKSNDHIRQVNNVLKWHCQCTFIDTKKNFYYSYKDIQCKVVWTFGKCFVTRMSLHKCIWTHCARLYGHLIHLYTAMIWVVKVFLAPIKVHWRCHFTTLLTWRMLSFDLPLNDVQITILSQQDIYVKIKGVYRTGFFLFG